MSGANTCAEVHAKRMPPHVKASSASVVPAMMMRFPLWIKRCSARKARSRLLNCYPHPVDTRKFVPDRSFRSTNAEEDGNENERDTRQW